MNYFTKQLECHNKLDEYCTKLFLNHGCTIKATGLEHRFSEEERKIIQSDPNNMEYLKERAYPDYEITTKRNYKIFVDYKAPPLPYDVMFIEALPWAFNIERQDKKTIYIYHNKHWNIYKFWIADDPFVISKIDRIIYREQKLLPGPALNTIQTELRCNIPRPSKTKAAGNNSGDCCAVIKKEHVMNLPNLPELFSYRMFDQGVKT